MSPLKTFEAFRKIKIQKKIRVKSDKSRKKSEFEWNFFEINKKMLWKIKNKADFRNPEPNLQVNVKFREEILDLGYMQSLYFWISLAL